MPEQKPGKDYIGVGGGALIFNDNDEVLLIRRGPKAKNEVGFWNKPGGAVEFGETVDQMMKREVKEEIGVEIEIIEYLPHTDHIIDDGKEHWVAFNCIAKIKSGEPKILEPEKSDMIGWFSFENLPAKLSQPTEEIIARLKKTSKNTQIVSNSSN